MVGNCLLSLVSSLTSPLLSRHLDLTELYFGIILFLLSLITFMRINSPVWFLSLCHNICLPVLLFPLSVFKKLFRNMFYILDIWGGLLLGPSPANRNRNLGLMSKHPLVLVKAGVVVTLKHHAAEEEAC